MQMELLIALSSYERVKNDFLLYLYSCFSRSADVASAWLDTLLDVIDLLPKDVIKRDVST